MKSDFSTVAPIDRHGSVDVSLHPSQHVDDIRLKSLAPATSNHNHSNNDVTKFQIYGISLNSYLRNVFLLYGYKKVGDEDIPGGRSSWEECMEPINVCLLTLATVSEILNRITYRLIVKRMNNVSYGSLSFLFYWISGFHAFMPDADLVQLKDRILHLGICYATLSTKLPAVGFTDDQRCKTILLALKSLISSIVKRRFMPFFSTMADPHVPLVVGQWTGVTEERKVLFKKSIEQAPQIKLEIFGGDMLLDGWDDSSEDEDEDRCMNRRQNDDGQGNMITSRPRPIARIPASFKLLQDPFTFMVLDSGIGKLKASFS